MNFIIRWLGIAIAVGVAVWLVPGIEVVSSTQSWIAIGLFGLILALINQTIRPILHLLSLPISCLTLGIFALVVNTAMLYLAQWVANGIFQVGFVIDTFGSAFVASIVISIVSAILNSVTGANNE
ncbi:MAG: phage holin family protein [Raoultibacter sp.]